MIRPEHNYYWPVKCHAQNKTRHYWPVTGCSENYEVSKVIFILERYNVHCILKKNHLFGKMNYLQEVRGNKKRIEREATLNMYDLKKKKHVNFSDI